MIQLKNIGVAFSGEYLFRGVDWHVKDSDRIGLVGDNGTGKSTLMKLIAGIITCDEGEVIRPKGTTFGYLPQDGLVLRGNTVFHEVKSVFMDLIELQNEIASLEHAMHETPHEGAEYRSLLERYDEAMREFNVQGGYTMETEIARVLHGLGFRKSDWDRKTEEFSGGWQMRIALAKLLLKKPTVLLLDEPTNHLDLLARNWLEEYLGAYPGTVIVVSHDRFFLDVVVKRIAALEFRKLHDYRKNYSGFLKEHSVRVALRVRRYREQQEEIERLRRFINRYRSDKKRTGQVHSRMKMLEKMELIEPPKHARSVKIRLPAPPRSGLKVLDLRDVSKWYGSNRVFDGINCEIQRGDRVALVGENGAGKSTLMRLLAGREPLSGGEVKTGSNVQAAYFAQDQAETMDGSHTVYEELEGAAPPEMYSRLRDMLGAFLFSGDDIDKRVSVLSGGERTRLTIVKMLLRPYNLLLLDEPTNHLDMKAKQVLLDALKGFKGTIVFVSHDRHFIDELAEKVIEVGSGNIVVYPGNYEDYQYYKSLREKGEGDRGVDGEAGPLKRKRTTVQRKKKAASKNYLKKIEKLEKLIAEKEESLGDIESEMAAPRFYDDRASAAETIAKHDALKRQIVELYDQWVKMHEDTE